VEERTIDDCTAKEYCLWNGDCTLCSAGPDNCPSDYNPDQLNSDGDGAGDICDMCPSDPSDSCDPSGTAAESIGSEGGIVANPNSEVSVYIPPESLAEETSISMSKSDEGVYGLDTDNGVGNSIFGYDLQPSGQTFEMPVEVTFLWNDIDNDGMEDSTGFDELQFQIFRKEDSQYIAITPICSDNPNCDPDVNVIVAELDHFSEYTLIAPADSDGDGVFDNWAGIVDKCPETVIPGNVPSEYLKPSGHIVPDTEYTFQDTFGCSCEQILYCKPGENKGEYKWGCSGGTMNVWVNQIGWSSNCQIDGVVALEGESKPVFENTDGSGLIDFFDTDNDGDQVSDSEDLLEDDGDSPASEGYGKPDWWEKKHPN